MKDEEVFYAKHLIQCRRIASCFSACTTSHNQQANDSKHRKQNTAGYTTSKKLKKKADSSFF